MQLLTALLHPSKISWSGFLAALIIGLLIVSCEQPASREQAEETAGTTEEAVSDTGTSALQILAGGTTFIGVLPCDGCRGIQTKITFAPNEEDAYLKESIYLGRSDSVYTETGSFIIEEAPSGQPTESLYILQPESGEEEAYYLRLMEPDELVQLTNNRERPENVEEYTLEKEGLQ